jgi:hydrogenase maturation protein HypF
MSGLIQPQALKNDTGLQRLRLTIHGAVQGVGFRPFTYRLAQTLGLTGWVSNGPQGVIIEAEGSQANLQQFLVRLPRELPPHSHIHSLETTWLAPIGYTTFAIRDSEALGQKTALVLPDIATCGHCLREIFDPNDRRHRYPFTNCTDCGPRFSIIKALPYDRANTTMTHFVMCERCRGEYETPLDRRFHAQPNACPVCGPHLELWDAQGRMLAQHDDALWATVDAIRRGMIVAVKGLGGFHLLVDARQQEAIMRLRRGKHRPEKPFALMYPTLASVQVTCEVSPLETRLLCSAKAPIVLLRRRSGQTTEAIAPGVAPYNPYLGIMLPYTPLHHLFMAALGFPVVATSGNLSDEPLCIAEDEAVERLHGIAEVFLIHNRPIARPVDDSVVRVIMGREMVLREGRGYAPFPIHLRAASPSILALGAHLKTTIAMSAGSDVLMSQHIGDLETPQALEAWRGTITTFQQLHDFQPMVVACDAHPDYVSTQWAQRSGLPVMPVQHHYAHVLSCMAENKLPGPVLGVAWDGTGYGSDGTIWGGEFLHVTADSWHRVAHLRPFRLPGGEKAIREPRRTALGLLYELFGEAAFALSALPALEAFSPLEQANVQVMLKRHLNTPVTSSVGRLFDAIAAILGLRLRSSFEAQAAMDLEFALDGFDTDEAYPLALVKGDTADAPYTLDWAAMVQAITEEMQQQAAPGLIAAKFHNALAEAIVAVAAWVGEKRVLLTGGCFQNRYLSEHAIQRLKKAHFSPYWHQCIPPNDGGIALGQIVAAIRARCWGIKMW